QFSSASFLPQATSTFLAGLFALYSAGAPSPSSRPESFPHRLSHCPQNRHFQNAAKSFRVDVPLLSAKNNWNLFKILSSIYIQF
ncbi:hypothetical protein, partial [Ligaoa zhengdingensis]|uniref:hypothetical protein n=1 Tax=Ligaoa zhengdingensis TaxID=2763658 RepID=UPI0031B9FD88